MSKNPVASLTVFNVSLFYLVFVNKKSEKVFEQDAVRWKCCKNSRKVPEGVDRRLKISFPLKVKSLCAALKPCTESPRNVRRSTPTCIHHQKETKLCFGGIIDDSVELFLWLRNHNLSFIKSNFSRWFSLPFSTDYQSFYVWIMHRIVFI